MNLATWAFAFVLVALFSLMPASGQGSQPAKPSPGQEDYDWKALARIRGLAEEDIASLEKNKVLMTNEAFKQVFTPYLRRGLPLFITSDSLLNAFHVLFEESILRLELANTTRLTGLLEALWERLAGGEKEFADSAALALNASRRAHIVLGVGLTLLGRPPKLEDQKLAKIIAAESERVVAAAGQTKPAWLGPPDNDLIAIDYSRYRPRGFYTKNIILERHFRAVSWLQSIPFRITKDEELLAALMLGHAARGLDLDVVQTYRHFIGTGDDWDLKAAAEEAGDPTASGLSNEGLETTRKRLRKRAGEPGQAPQINDQIRFPQADPNGTAESGFRILPAYRTPDAVLFHRTTDLREFPAGRLPSGLEVCAALGSTFAREQLAGIENGKVLAVIDRNRGLFAAGDSIYFEYLGCLAALLGPPEPAAPAFMSSHAWQAKSCQTVLAGWAQLRHTWILQAKKNVWSFGRIRLPQGFIEPSPCFFARMNHLARGTEDLLRSAGAFQVSRSALGSMIHDVIRTLNEDDGSLELALDVYLDTDLDKDRATWDENWTSLVPPLSINGLEMVKFFHRLRAHARKAGIKDSIERTEFLFPSEPIIEFLEKIVKKLAEDDELFGSEERNNISGHSTDLVSLWQNLEEICDQLEKLARKQLDGQLFTEEDDLFVWNYGSRIARVMLYLDNSYLLPNDNAPRIGDISMDPRASRYLHVGISRPRALYVLYPHQGREILCRGAVLPYYEFAHGHRLTDDRWKAMLDSEARPAVPGWIRPIIGTEGISSPDKMEKF